MSLRLWRRAGPVCPGQAEHVYHIEQSVWVPSPLQVVFGFFSDPVNLNHLTPPWLHFRITTPTPISMRTGRLIDYRLRLRGIPLRWQSEITGWDPPHRFVDEQRYGPYRLWVHEHRFESSRDGTTIIDRVSYVPRGGALLHRRFVQPNLATIFAYRCAQLLERFGGDCAENGQSRAGGGADAPTSAAMDIATGHTV